MGGQTEVYTHWGVEKNIYVGVNLEKMCIFAFCFGNIINNNIT